MTCGEHFRVEGESDRVGVCTRRPGHGGRHDNLMPKGPGALIPCAAVYDNDDAAMDPTCWCGWPKVRHRSADEVG